MLWTKPFVAMLFVDTSALYALADRSDRHHAEAVSTFTDFVESYEPVTSDHVAVESWLLIRSRLGRAAALSFWDGIAGGAVALLGITAQDFWRGHAIARQWRDQAFSIVDCTSFALIERLAIARAFAFDIHFRIFRYGPLRRRALEVVPG
jgi:uncharacterized protein